MNGAQGGASDLSQLRARLREKQQEAAAARLAAAHTRAIAQEARATAALMRQEAAEMLARLRERRAGDHRSQAWIVNEHDGIARREALLNTRGPETTVRPREGDADLRDSMA